MKYLSYKFNEAELSRLVEVFKDHALDPDGSYVLFYARVGDTQIRAYHKSKNHDYYKVVFGGPNPDPTVDLFDPTLSKEVKQKAKGVLPDEYLDINEQIGSDEVGFGDFFGPIVVSAAYLKDGDIDLVHRLGISDSKLLSDERILQIGPLLLAAFDVETLVVNNLKFNELIAKGYNMNKIKAMLHNHALGKLKIRHKGHYHAYIDQFVSEDKYKEYLETPMISNVVFQIKGEHYYPSIAVASVAARYQFLLEMAALGKKYNVTFPLGASNIVDEFASAFLKKFGETTFKNVTKNNFSNFQKALIINNIEK